MFISLMDPLIHGIEWASWKILIRIHQPRLFQVGAHIQDHEFFFHLDALFFQVFRIAVI